MTSAPPRCRAPRPRTNATDPVLNLSRRLKINGGTTPGCTRQSANGVNNSRARCGEQRDIAGACGGDPIRSGSGVGAERSEMHLANSLVAKEEGKEKVK